MKLSKSVALLGLHGRYGDFDGDGDPDWLDQTNKKVLQNVGGTLVFWANWTGNTAVNGGFNFQVGDVNGKDDVVTGDVNGFDTHVYTNDGAGAFGGSIINVSPTFANPAVGDLDGDGDLDLVGLSTLGASGHVFLASGVTPPSTNQDPDCSLAAIADQNADANCGATISGADVTGVTDPDGDALTITVSPTTLNLGANIVTVTADDGNGGTCSTTITVNVVDDTAPVATASLAPVADDDDDNDTFAVQYSATDNCDANPTVSSVMQSPAMSNPTMKFKTKNKQKLVFDFKKAVTLQIFNSAGQVVRTLVAGDMPAGQHSVTWNALDDSGVRVASGRKTLFKTPIVFWKRFRKVNLKLKTR